YNVAHIAINALGLGFVAVVLLMMWERHPRPGWLVAAGVVLGVMTGFKQNMGFFVLAGAALWLAEYRVPSTEYRVTDARYSVLGTCNEVAPRGDLGGGNAGGGLAGAGAPGA